MSLVKNLNENQIDILAHAKRNQNRFYGEVNDKDLNDLVEKGYMVKRGGWEADMAYYVINK